MKRKDLQPKLLANLQDYSIFNALAISSLLSRVNSIFEQCKDDLL